MQVFQKNSNIFNLLSEGVSEGIIVVNFDQVIVATNSSAEEMFGYSKDELLGQSLNLLIPAKHVHAHKAYVTDFVDKSEKRQMGRGRNLYGLRKNGMVFPLEAGLNPFELYGSKYVMALVMDITERKKAEKELIHWSTIFNESLNEIFIFDAETLHFKNVNKGALKNMGYDLEEFRKLTPVDIKPMFDETGFRNLIAPLLERQKEKLEFESLHQRKDGTTYPVEVHMQMSDLSEEKVFVAIILDITDRKNYTEKLERTVEERTKQLTDALAKEKELNELKTRFLSLVSHEFKTPLSSIMTSVTLLSKYDRTEQQGNREKHVNTIKNKVRYLDAILNDFLSLERLESGKVNYKIDRFPLSKLINEVVYDANMLLKEGQRIIYPHDIDHITVAFEQKILELALSNLVHNAIKYSAEHTIVEIQVKEYNQLLTLDIIDQGIGIPAQEQKHIFNRYFRAENALLSQGTGIGLSITKQHLENLGASLSFVSEENKGSIFTIKIPENIATKAPS